MEQNVNSIGALFDALVSLIQACFTFLPDWTLLFMGSAFSFVIAVLIFKLVLK